MNHKKMAWWSWGLVLLVFLYLGFLLISPITAIIRGAFQEGISAIWGSLTSLMLLQALLLSVKIAFIVVSFQLIFGTLTAWVIVRQKFFGKSLLNHLIDVPFSISPVVVGYMLLLLFGRTGFFYPVLEKFNVQIAFAVPGMVFATLFVCMPFMVREMIPVIRNLDFQQEFAAATLGAGRWICFWRIIFPQIKSALGYGMTLTLARALGEFGAVLIIGGGVQGRTETTTLYIFRSLEERRYIDAYSAALLLGVFSVTMVFVSDWLRNRQRKTHKSPADMEWTDQTKT